MTYLIVFKLLIWSKISILGPQTMSYSPTVVDKLLTLQFYDADTIL